MLEEFSSRFQAECQKHILINAHLSVGSFYALRGRALHRDPWQQDLRMCEIINLPTDQSFLTVVYIKWVNITLCMYVYTALG